MRLRTISDLDRGHNNNFNLIRMVAATSVLVSHAYPLAQGEGSAEPLQTALHGTSLGSLAVIVFFCISGYFISKSMDRKGDVLDFLIARGLRLYPGLVVVLVLTVIALGPAFSSEPLGQYWSNGAVYSYLPKNLSLKYLQYGLPGVFKTNPYPDAINGSLWSLFYEVFCYSGVVAIAILYKTQGRRGPWLASALYAAFYIVPLCNAHLARVVDETITLKHIHDLSLPFFLGMIAYHFRRIVILHVGLFVPLLLTLALLRDSDRFYEALVVATSYGTFLFGFAVDGAIRTYNRLGDFSYGTYIYAFPVQQMIVASMPSLSPLLLMTLSFPVTLLFAVTSWHLVERPALTQRTHVRHIISRRSLRERAI